MNDVIDISASDLSFVRQIEKLSGTNLNVCWHCRCCAGGCPFIEIMDYPPHGVIRLVQLGFKRQALECSTIWICVGCHTCAVQCPTAVDIAAVMDSLREMAIEENADIAEPEVLSFHREVMHSIKRYGRTHKLEIMMRYKVQQLDLFSDIDVGLKMLAKRKLDLRPSKIRNKGDLQTIFRTI